MFLYVYVFKSYVITSDFNENICNEFRGRDITKYGIVSLFYLCNVNNIIIIDLSVHNEFLENVIWCNIKKTAKPPR